MNLKYCTLAGVLIVMLLILSACGQNEIKDAKNWPVAGFSYTDQNGQPFSLDDLKGKVWVADFIFTSCDDVCLPMTANMKKLQDQVKEEGIENIQFVSFSVDPAVDSPEVLTEFANQFSVDYENWHFLTGYSQTDIESFAMESFKAIVKKPQSGDQVIHGTDIYLVDSEGKIMKYYTGLAEMPMDEIINDIKILQN
jgi:protein SCO1